MRNTQPITGSRPSDKKWLIVDWPDKSPSVELSSPTWTENAK